MWDKLKSNKFFRKMAILICSILSFLNRFIPKGGKRILFYDSARDFLDDNTEAFYSWLRLNGYQQKYKLIVCVPKEKHRLNFSTYKPVGPIRGIFAFLHSKYVFFSFGDFRIRPSKSQIVINQWHGVGLKKGGKLLSDESYQSERLDNFTFVLCSSKTLCPVFAKTFGCNENKVVLMGGARTDYLFGENDSLSALSIQKNKYRKLIIWMPTFRKSKDSRFNDGFVESETLLPLLDTTQKMNDVNNFLQKEGMLLLIKYHPLALTRDFSFSNIRTCSNIDILSKGFKLYQLLGQFDALITDYSSVYTDFLLLNKPIGFTIDDISLYSDSRGFLVSNPTDYMPGPHIRNVEDFIHFLGDISNNEDPYLLERKKVNSFFNSVPCRNNCENLADFCGIKK